MHRIVVVAACVMGVLVAHHARAQSPAGGGPRFEVASVKPVDPFADIRRNGAQGGPIALPELGVRIEPGGRLIAVATLRTLIMQAYGIQVYQLDGGPKWLPSDYFSISAKAPSENATQAEMNEMLKALLAERFGLRVHVETRPSAVHTLTVARSDGRLGPGLKRTSPECERDLEERKRTGKAAPPVSGLSGVAPRLTPICGNISSMVTATGVETWAAGGRPFADLVTRLSGELKAPVADQTGLDGLFDVLLEFESTRRPPRGLDPNGTDPLPVPLPQAVQQQLGLKLEKATAPLPITIVDAVEPPTAN